MALRCKYCDAPIRDGDMCHACFVEERAGGHDICYYVDADCYPIVYWYSNQDCPVETNLIQRRASAKDFANHLRKLNK